VGSVVTASFVMASIGAFYLLSGKHQAYGRTFVRLAVSVGVFAVLLQLFPTGDRMGHLVATHQPMKLAAMEGLFETVEGAPLAILGQPDVENRRLDNPLVIPKMLSFLTYQRWNAEVKGLDQFPREDWPNVPLVYYSYHVMVGLGTFFIAIMLAARWLLWKERLFEARGFLWVLLLALPFPYIANTAGWITSEAGRQPWIIYGLMRTSEGISPLVSAGNAWFTLIGFMGLYSVLSVLFLFLCYRAIEVGPEKEAEPERRAAAAGA
jgi:cytochrome bd ubiquinol oxidase subunit I